MKFKMYQWKQSTWEFTKERTTASHPFPSIVVVIASKTGDVIVAPTGLNDCFWLCGLRIDIWQKAI